MYNKVEIYLLLREAYTKIILKMLYQSVVRFKPECK